MRAAIDEAVDDAVEGYSEQMTERIESTLGCTQEFLMGIGKVHEPRIAQAKW